MTKLRELKEIAKNLDDIQDEMKKWILNLEREFTRAEWDKLVKKEIELEREFYNSLEEKCTMKSKINKLQSNRTLFVIGFAGTYLTVVSTNSCQPENKH